MNGVVHRELRRSDAGRCAELEEILFTGEGPWSREMVDASIAATWTFYVGVFDADTDELLGYAGLGILGPRDDLEFEVQTIGVDPAHQGRGLGRGLMEQLLHTVDLLGGPTFLEVRTDNEPAITLYRSLGFEIVGTRRGYYQPSGGDAYTMTRPAGEPDKEKEKP